MYSNCLFFGFYKLIVWTKILNMRLRTMTYTKTELALQKGREILYLVLRKKPFSKEIIEIIEREVEKRFQNYILTIASQLENVKFKDPEKCLKIIILKSIINILKNMIQEDIIKLSENDLNVLFQLLNEEEKNIKLIDNNDDLKNKNNPRKKNKKEKEKEDNNSSWWNKIWKCV